MTRQLRRAVVIGLGAAMLAQFALAGATSQHDPQKAEMDRLQDQLKEVELKLETALRKVPAKFDPAEEVDLAQRMAKRAELGAIEVKPLPGSERVKLEDGRPSPVELFRLEVSGRDPYGDVLFFLHMMGSRYRLSELESLHLVAGPGDTVRFTARWAFPCYTGTVDDPAAERPGDVLGLLRGVLRERELTYRKLLELEERSKPDRLLYALAAFDRESWGRTVALTEVRAAREIVFKGVVAGRSARQSLEPTLGKTGFQVKRVQTTPAGSCQAFTVTTGLAKGEQPRETVGGNGIFDDQTAQFCAVTPAAHRVAARGTGTGPEALTLRLRKVTWVDLFSVLHELKAGSFLLGPELTGRIDVDVEGATLDEALAAMGSAGVAVGPGPLRRVSRAGGPTAATAPAPAAYTGELTDVSVRNADLLELACLLATTMGRQIWSSQELDSGVSVFATSLPMDQVLDGLVATAGLVAVLDGDRLVVGPGPAAELRGRPGAVDACKTPRTRTKPSASISRLATVDFTPAQLHAADLELAGLARTADVWTAWVHAPSKRLVRLEPGLKLADATVSAVGPTGVVLKTDAAGDLSLPFTP